MRITESNYYTTNHYRRSNSHLEQPSNNHQIEEAYLMDHLLSQSSLFESLQLAQQINILNGYQAVTKYQIQQIKNHFRQIQILEIKKGFSENQNPKNHFSNNPKKENLNSKKSKVDSNKSSFKKEYQKSYMQLLSI